MSRRSPLLATGALLLTTASWGSTFFLIKDLLDRVPTLDFLAVRFAIAGAVMLALAHRSVLALPRPVLLRAALHALRRPDVVEHAPAAPVRAAEPGQHGPAERDAVRRSDARGRATAALLHARRRLLTCPRAQPTGGIGSAGMVVARARLAAQTTARSEAVTMLWWMPIPHTISPAISHST